MSVSLVKKKSERNERIFSQNPYQYDETGNLPQLDYWPQPKYLVSRIPDKGQFLSDHVSFCHLNSKFLRHQCTLEGSIKEILGFEAIFFVDIPCDPAMLSRRKLSGDPPETVCLGSPRGLWMFWLNHW